MPSSPIGSKNNVKIFVLYLMRNINYPLDFVTINEIAEKYRGGGHDCASGATLLKKSEIRKLLADADAHLKNFKENNEGWL